MNIALFDSGGRQVTTHCVACGVQVTLPDIGCMSQWAERYGTYCDPCFARQQRADDQAAIQRAKTRVPDGWSLICPPDFLDTDPAKLPLPKKLQMVLQWQYGRRGLNLCGASGKGKSRCAWLLLKREYKAHRSIAQLNHRAGVDFAARYSESAKDAEEWCSELDRADILLLDDVFKAKPTESFEAALFSVISRRTEYGRPIIATMNDTGATLLSRLSSDRGPALVRRLRDYSDSISFA